MINFVNEIESKALEIMEEAEQANRRNKRYKNRHYYTTDAKIENGAFRINVGSIERSSFLYFNHNPDIGNYYCCLQSPFFNTCSFNIYFEDDGYDMELKEWMGYGNPDKKIKPETFLRKLDKIKEAIQYNNI